MAVALPERPFPLQWPEDWTRTPETQRRDARYRVGLSDTRELILEELQKMGVKRTARGPSVVLSSEIPCRGDGLPYANYMQPKDPGVAVWWIDKDGETRVIACDAWRVVPDNFRAVALTIKALRDIERTKASQILERTMQSFKVYALPSKPWFVDTLELPAWPATIEDVNESYKLKAVALQRTRNGEGVVPANTFYGHYMREIDEQLKQLGQAKSEALRALGV